MLRQHDTVARVGGDEFVVLLEQLADVSDATQLAERVRMAIKQPIELEDSHLVVSASIDVVVTNETTSDADTLLRWADDVMCVAKRRGRDQVAVHPDAIADRDPGR